MSIGLQLLWLAILALPIACVAWTVTHEEIFREPREYAERKSQSARSLLVRKFFYIFTCEYCFSFYVTLFFLAVTRYQLLYPDWRGYLVAGFALVFIANFYMGLFAKVKIGVKKERVELKAIEKEVKEKPAREKKTA